MDERVLEVKVAERRTSALLRLPISAGPVGLVVHCPGWMSTKDAGHYRRYHESFAAAGIATAIFDYPAFMRSSTSPVIDPDDMVDEALAVIHAVRDHAEIGAAPVVTIGSGAMGGAVALLAAVHEDDIAAVAMISPIASGESWLRAMHGRFGYERLLARVESDRLARARGEPAETIRPMGGISVPPPERAQMAFKRDIRSQLVDEVSIESVERLARLRPVAHVAALAPRPLLLIACRDDVAVPYDDARRLRDAARGPVRLVTLEGTSSYRMHDTHWRGISLEIIELVRGFSGGTAVPIPTNPTRIEGE